MHKVTLTIHPSVIGPAYLAEIGQSQSTKQALVKKKNDGNYERISAFVKCRDFLVDSYSYSKDNLKFGIYGFHFDGTKLQPDWDQACLAHFFSDDKAKNAFLSNIGYIHSIEHANGWPETTVYEAENNILVTEGNKAWLANSLTFSLYSFLLRVACYPDFSKDQNVGTWLIEFGKQQFSDSKYVASISTKTWDRALGNLRLLATPTFCGFDPKKDPVGNIHHNSGFISVFGSHSEISYGTVKKNAHWQLMKERGFELHPKALAA
jgi:hypothetical protein